MKVKLRDVVKNFLKSSSLIFLLASVIVFIFAIYIFDSRFQSRLNELKSTKLEEIKDRITITTNIYEQLSSFIFDRSINTEEITSLIKIASNTQNQYEIEEVRKKLLKQNFDLYNQITKYHFRQLHYHLPDTRSLLRMHRPEKWGDILADDRYTVKMANQEKLFQFGFEEGKIFNGYRFVYPLFHEQEHVGSVEISISIGAIIDNLNNLFRSNYYFMIDKDIVDKKVFADERTANYSISPISSKYYVDRNVTNQVYNQFNLKTENVQNLKKLFAKRLNFKEDICEYLKHNNNLYLFLGVPIKNAQGIQTGYILEINQNTTEYKNLITNRLKFYIFVTTVFLLFLTLNILFQILNANRVKIREQIAVLAMGVTANHEINQPLSIILGNAEMLEMGELKEKDLKKIRKIKDMVNKIKRILDRMNNLTDVKLEKYIDTDQMIDIYKE